MKLQGHEVKFNFRSAAKYDKYASREGLRTTSGIVRGIAKEIERIEVKYGKPFSELSDKERTDFVIPMDTGEAQYMYYSTIDLPEREVDNLLEKEMEKKSILEIVSEVVVEFMQSKLFQAQAIKEKDENPKQPK